MPTAAEDVAFLFAILANESDDGPRLIYADYLMESDDPADLHQAEFIRLQVALHRLPAEHPRRRELKAKADELVHRHLPSWTAHLRGLATGFTFHRGVLDTVSVDATTFLVRGAELLRKAPTIRSVKFLDAARHIASLASCEHLAKVRELGLCGADLGNGGLAVLLHSPHLTNLRGLDLSFNGLDDTAAMALARTSSLVQLEELRLNDNGRLTATGLGVLAESPHLSGLRLLDVSANDVGAAGIVAVANSPYLEGLTSFVVHTNRIGDRGAEALAQSELLGRMLQHEPKLALPRCGIGPTGAQALAQSIHAGKISELDLTGNVLADEGIRAFAESEELRSLRRFVLISNQITDFGARMLAYSPLMKQLDFLDVTSNRLTRRGVDWLWSHRKDFQTVLEHGDNLTAPTTEDLLREVIGGELPIRLLLDSLPRRGG